MTDATNDNNAAPPGDGEGAFGGFATQEELVAAYQALKTPTPAPAKTGDPTITPAANDGEGEGEGTDDDAQVADALKAAGLNQDDFTKEFAETSDLSEESKAKLEAKGFPREMVEVYLEGLRSKQSAYSSTVFGPAGGEAGYKELIAWAAKTLPEAEIDAFNATIQSGNAASAKLAVAGLVAAKNQGKAVILNGKNHNSQGVKPYESQAQIRAALADPRYRNDPAYRRAHEARLMASP